MIFNLGKGKIEVTLDKYNFLPGETIKGKVSLKLKRPTQGSELKVSFMGIKIITERIRASKIAPTRTSSFYTQVSKVPPSRDETSKITLHSFNLILGREKEYFNEEYPFEIKIPDNALIEKAPEIKGVMGTIIKTSKLFSGSKNTTSTRFEWYVEASLAIPKSLDIKKRADITLG